MTAADVPAPAAGQGRRSVSGSGLARYFRPRLLLLSLALWLVFGLLTTAAAGTSWLPGDVGLAQWIQSVSWGPVGSLFGVVTWLGGGPQDVLAVVTIILVAVVNRRATPLALLVVADAALYLAFNTLLHKPRPAPGLIRVTEQAGAFAFPSGHATFVVTIVAVILLCLGPLVLSRRLLGLAAIVGAAMVLIVGVQRIYVGAHYPSDVLGGFLLASAWLCLVLSIRRLSGPVLSRLQPPIEV